MGDFTETVGEPSGSLILPGTPEPRPARNPELSELDSRFRAYAGQLGLSDLEGVTLLTPAHGSRNPRDTVRRRALACADVLALAVAYLTMLVVARPEATLDRQSVLLAALPMWVLLNKLLGLYDRDANRIERSTIDELPTVLHSLALGAALVYFVGPDLLGGAIGRRELLAFAVAGAVVMPLARGSVRAVVRSRSAPERAIVVGSGIVAGMLARKIADHREYGIGLLGFLDDSPVSGAGALPSLGRIGDFERVCDELAIERVVIAFSTSEAHGDLLDVIRIATRRRLKISVVPRLFEVIGRGVEVDSVEGLTLLTLRGATRTRSTLALKRAIDVTGAGLALICVAPLLALIALAVVLTSKGPVLFAQRRTGRDNREFRMLKFRTMIVGAHEMQHTLHHRNDLEDRRLFKIVDDPRITRVGRLLRRTSLDELPQLWNVLRGEMSLVGPRPLVPSEDAHVIGWHRTRLDLTPGLTGPWQVLGRTAIPFDEMVKLDYLYVADWSVWNDVKLMLRTLPVVLRGTGH